MKERKKIQKKYEELEKRIQVLNRKMWSSSIARDILYHYINDFHDARRYVEFPDTMVQYHADKELSNGSVRILELDTAPMEV